MAEHPSLTRPAQPLIVAPRVVEQYRRAGVPFPTGGVATRSPGARYPTGPLAASPSGNTALVEAREVLGDLQQILGILNRQNLQDSPEYDEVRNLARELSETMRKARLQGTPPPTSTPPPAAPSLPAGTGASLAPLTSTLGMKGQPGVTSSGPEVITLQTLLNLQGISLPSTGIYDARTAAAVRELQQRNGLSVTGMVGAETRRFLNGLLPQA